MPRALKGLREAFHRRAPARLVVEHGAVDRRRGAPVALGHDEVRLERVARDVVRERRQRREVVARAAAEAHDGARRAQRQQLRHRGAQPAVLAAEERGGDLRRARHEVDALVAPPRASVGEARHGPVRRRVAERPLQGRRRQEVLGGLRRRRRRRERFQARLRPAQPLRPAPHGHLRRPGRLVVEGRGLVEAARAGQRGHGRVVRVLVEGVGPEDGDGVVGSPRAARAAHGDGDGERVGLEAAQDLRGLGPARRAAEAVAAARAVAGDERGAVRALRDELARRRPLELVEQRDGAAPLAALAAAHDGARELRAPRMARDLLRRVRRAVGAVGAADGRGVQRRRARARAARRLQPVERAHRMH